MAASRKTLKRSTAESLLTMLLARVGDDEPKDVRDLIALAKHELYGEAPPAIETDPSFELLWRYVPPLRRQGKMAARREWLKAKKRDNWPGDEAVILAYDRYKNAISRQHPDCGYGDDSWVRYLKHLERWLSSEGYLD